MPAPGKKPVKKRWTPRMVSRLMLRKARKRRRTQASGLEKKVLGWLDNVGIAYRKQYAVGRCHVDILIEPDLVIEVNGCYWHGHERCQPKTPGMARKRGKDKRRYKYLLSCRYKLLLLWECDIEEDGEAATIAKIRRRMNYEYGEQAA
jgi:G:T-mismatch repair DNA endonuclease (very short patch repair protein)